MRNLTHFFIANSKVTFVLTFFLIVFGIGGIYKMNAESYPSVDFATAIIETEYFGATPEDIEIKITKPIEDEIRTVSGLKDVRSVSQAGRSKIVVRVDMDNPKVIVKDVMSDLQKVIDRAKNLPSDLREKPKFTEIKSEEFAAVEIAIIGSNQNRLRDLVADALKEDIEDNKNVKAVILDGYRKREFIIDLDPKKLDQFHIGVDEVLRKIRTRNMNIPGGELKSHSLQQLVKVDAKVKSASELSMTPIRSTLTGKVIYLKDVAIVKDGEEKPRTLTHYMGEDATLMTVQKKGGADTLKLVSALRPILKRYREKYEGDLRFKVFNDEGLKVAAKLDTLTSNALTGLIVVISVLLFFMHGRVGILVSFSLPLSLLATLGIMPSFGLSLNSITILSLIIAMGMLIDNSVVVSEEYLRRRKLGIKSLEAAVTTVQNLWIPISATAFTTIAAFLPMIVTTGVMGRFIYAIPVVVSSALLFCLVESFFLLPMRLHLFSKNLPLEEKTSKKEGLFDKFSQKFEKFMSIVVDHRYLTALSVTFIIAFSFYVIKYLNKFILFPPEQTEIYLARIETPSNTKIEKTHEVTKDIERKIKTALGDKILKHSVSIAGSSLSMPTDIKGQFGENVSLVKIYVTDYAKNNIRYDKVLKILRKISAPEGVKLTFEEQVNGPPVGAPVTVTYRSHVNSSLEKVTKEISSSLERVPGVFDIKVDDVIGPDEVKVLLNYEKLDRLGLSASSVGETIRTALTGSFISDVTLANKEILLKVKFSDDFKKDLSDLGNVKIMDGRGNLVPLSIMASFQTSKGTPQVKRLDFKRAKTVTANIDTKVITSVNANAIVNDTFEKISSSYPEVSMVFGGEQESTKESLTSLMNAMVLALIGIYAIMVYIFRSFLAPGLIMTTIPLGLLGVSVSFWAHGRPISFLAMIGVIGLSGIIVNNGIILIDFINQMRDEGKLPLREILIKASTIRLRPVMATSLTTMGGLFPTAYGVGGADSMLSPMTMAMAWGLTTGTLLTLIWLPAGFAIFQDLMKLMSRLPFLSQDAKNSSEGDYFTSSDENLDSV